MHIRNAVLTAAVGLGAATLFVLSAGWFDSASSPAASMLTATPTFDDPAVAAPPVLPATTEIPVVTDAPSWVTQYRTSTDRFAFAEAAAAAAVTGDIRAQYALSQVLLECYVEVALTVAQGKENLAANIEARVGAFPGYQEQDRMRMRSKIQRCERFFDASPLSSFNLPDEAQSHQYWFDQAVAGGDPLAVMDRAAKLVAQADFAGDREASRSLGLSVLADVRVAVNSREPEAVAKVGWMYSNHRVARDQAFQGPAWLLAACQLGYDCSTTNPELNQGCVDSGSCAGLTLADVLQRDLGPNGYARAYAAGQDIAYKVTQSDWDGLQQYLETRL